MQRAASFIGTITTMLAATLACSSSSDGGIAHTDGANGDASATGGSGGVTTETGGATGTGGVLTGAGGSISTGTASIVFTVSGPDSYCGTSQCGGRSIDIKDALGNSLTLDSTCGTASCSTCEATGCPNFFCPPEGVAITGAQFDWNGMYYAPGTCGAGMACLETTPAKPGKYTATFCATPGKLSGPDGGQRQCVASGAARCGHVDFDFPTSVTVTGTVGP